MLVTNFHRVEPPAGPEMTRIGTARFRRILNLTDHGAAAFVFLIAGAVGRTDDWM